MGRICGTSVASGSPAPFPLGPIPGTLNLSLFSDWEAEGWLLFPLLPRLGELVIRPVAPSA